MVFAVIGFAGYQVSMKNSSQASSATKETDTTEKKALVTTESEKPVIIPETKPAAAPVAEPAPVTKTAPAPVKTATPEVKKDKIYLNLTSLVAAQNGSKIDVHSRLDKPASGTCTFKLYQAGYPKVYATSKIANAVDCVGQLDVSALPIYSGWTLFVWFDGDDGRTYAYQKERLIDITQP